MSQIDDLIEFSLSPASAISQRARALAELSFLDWIVCGLAGIQEPLAQKLRRFADHEGGAAQAHVFGGGQYPTRMAALVNGATSHALDYDDTHFAHVGHLSVGIYPAAFAVGQAQDLPASQVVDAFAIGAEVAIRLGMSFGAEHYYRGYHQTATAGAFGATVAAGRLLGLTRSEMAHALGLCATRASGLRGQFGTMGKPYNAGLSAANGVECAQLASLGFTSDPDGVWGAQGFVATHSTDPHHISFQVGQEFLFENNKYKLHACCHGLHAMIEALDAANLRGIGLEKVSAVEIFTNPRWLTVCDKKAPQSGLDTKFSYSWLAGMALRGDETGNDRTYSDELSKDEALIKFAQKVGVFGDEALSDMQVRGAVIIDGRRVGFDYDLDAFVSPRDLQTKLERKAVTVLGERGHGIWANLSHLSKLSCRDLTLSLA